MRTVDQILRMVRDCPGTAVEVAAELCLDYRAVSSYLSRLHLKHRAIDRKLFRVSDRGHPVYIYGRTEDLR